MTNASPERVELAFEVDLLAGGCLRSRTGWTVSS